MASVALLTVVTADAKPRAADATQAFAQAIREKYDLEEQAFAKHDAGLFFDRFYTSDAISVEEDAGILVGSAKIRTVYDEIVKGNHTKIESVHTYVNGNAGWDWTDYHVTPLDPQHKPFTVVVLYLWSRVGGQWMCKGDFAIGGSLRSGHLSPIPP